jgi:hypothetical protein
VLSDDSRSQKASLNMVASILDYGARVVVGLLINPLLVSRLGDLAFGVYQTLARLIGWATPAGGRPSQALKWTIARHQHSVQFEEKRLQVGSAVAVWFIFLPVLALAGGLLRGSRRSCSGFQTTCTSPCGSLPACSSST